MEYRKEIDGLRALAVVPVILFHAGFSFFSGGFVGVDVFFVISGFLITSILINDLTANNFSITKFYERRIRRILPALFFVILVCIPFAWAWLLPNDLRRFSGSIVSVVLFISNHLFKNQTGYFDTSAEFKPLLHTWSLSVEEQYYVLFPLFLMLVWRIRRSWVFASIVTLTIASFLFANHLVKIQPSSAFFILPTRAWEILLGALSALIIHKRNNTTASTKISSVASLAGLFLIVFSVLFYDNTTPSPSFYTLAPTFGTALILLFANTENLTGKLLANKVLVGIGLISYSAYLWHQPIFAFARHRSFDQPSIALMCFLSAISLLAAFFTWKYIENPFRNPQIFSRAKIFLFALIGSILMILIGIVGHHFKGFPKRLEPEKLAFINQFENISAEQQSLIDSQYWVLCNFYDVDSSRRGKSTNIPVEKIPSNCYTRDSTRKHSVFLWGNSHAEHLYPGLSSTLPSDWQIMKVTSSACEANLVADMVRNDYCHYSNWFSINAIKASRPDVVIIGQNVNHDPVKMEQIGSFLLSLGINKVIFTGPAPIWINDLPKLVTKQWGSVPKRTTGGLDELAFKTEKKIKHTFIETDKLKYVSVIDNFCNMDGCLVHLDDNIRSGLTSWDSNHLSPAASLNFAINRLAPAVLN